MANPSRWVGSVSAVLATVAACTPAPPEEPVWGVDWPAAQRVAARTGRPLLVRFERADRPVCRAMAESSWLHPEVCAAVGETVAVRLDADRCAALFAQLVGGGGVLATCVLAADGSPVAVHRGFASGAVLAAFLRRALDAAPTLEALRVRRAAPDARLSLGLRLAALGCTAQAEEILIPLASLEVAAIAVPACQQLAHLAAERGDHRVASDRLAQARRLDPGGVLGRPVVAALGAAIALAGRRQPQPAHDLLSDTLHRYPDCAERPQLLLELARAQHELDRDAAAIDGLAELLARWPASARADAAAALLAHIRAPDHGHTH